MCRFFSAIVQKKNIIWDIDIDNHTTLLEKAGIKDVKTDPNFVRVELLPQDNDIFNHDLKNWKLRVDQDFKPEWFDESAAEKQMKKIIGDVFVRRFIKSKIKEVTEGRWFLGTGGTIQYVRGGTIQDVIGGTIQYVSGGTIQDVRGGTIQYVSGGTIQDVSGGTIQDVIGGTIQYVIGGTIQDVRGGTIQDVRGGTIQDVRGGTIQDVRGGTIQYVSGGTIQYVSGGTIQYVIGGTIQYVRGGTIQYVSGGTIQDVIGGTIQDVRGGTIQLVNFIRPGKIGKITEKGIVIFADGNSKRIVVADPKIKIEVAK